MALSTSSRYGAFKSLALALLLLLSGCAATSAWVDAQKVCASDPECLSEAKGYAKIGEVVASGFGPVAGAGAGATIVFLALGILGLRKKKKEGV